MEAGPPPCRQRWLGRVGYAEALGLQERLAAEAIRAREEGGRAEHLLLLEHPHVITLGRNARAANVLAGEGIRQARGVALYAAGRGGDVTYHGPGQLVGYPILDLKPDRCDVRRYVRDLEESLIRTAADFGVTAGRVERLTGVWVESGRGGRPEKLAAIGVRIARWITSHGFAFNVTTDLSYFGLIVPCGIVDHGVTSLEKLTGRAFPLEEVAARAGARLGEVFGRRMVDGPSAASGEEAA
ncbi:MAG TPA: lipoyl(octanoyl) transferase LipB [Candidatus Polarisedimenticolia bacterium]|nr:lipoyl(octanoyl) transferase LipB [Candidatus Polarisedimenticolia bacterium]